MMRNKKVVRWACLGLLCGGLLLTGIGTGMQLVEACSLSYGGEKLIQNSNVSSNHIVVELVPEAEQVSILSYDRQLSEQLKELGRIETSDAVTPGTVEIDFRYEGSQMEFTYWDDYSEASQQVYLTWYAKSELSTLLACKDAVLEDLKQGQISDYVLYNLTEAIITVHPDDANRISLE